MAGFIPEKRFRDVFIQSFKRCNRRDVEIQPHRGRISPQAAVMGSANGKQAEDNIQSQGGEEKADDGIRPMRPWNQFDWMHYTK